MNPMRSNDTGHTRKLLYQYRRSAPASWSEQNMLEDPPQSRSPTRTGILECPHGSIDTGRLLYPQSRGQIGTGILGCPHGRIDTGRLLYPQSRGQIGTGILHEMPTREHRYEETTVPTQEIPVSMRAAAGNVGAPSPDLRLSNYGHAKMPSRVQRPTKRWAPGPALSARSTKSPTHTTPKPQHTHPTSFPPPSPPSAEMCRGLSSPARSRVVPGEQRFLRRHPG